jgi:hypothetical protein
MDREIDRDERPALSATRAHPERAVDRRVAPEKPPPSREHALIQERGYTYRLSPAELETMHDIGRFRTVAIDDLARHRYQGETALMRQDLRALGAQGLVQPRMVWSGPRSKTLRVVVLTKLGKDLLERHGPVTGDRCRRGDQAIYAGFVKPAEVRHDAAIYRMYHAAAARIAQQGGAVRRIVLDYELKKKVYAPLAKVKQRSPTEYANRQAAVAQENGLKVVHGKIPLPDLRLEYETPDGEMARVDLELATHHYHGSHLQMKAAAGFTFYAAEGSAARLTRVLEERDIVATLLSL